MTNEGLSEIIGPLPVPSPRDNRERNDDPGQKRRGHRYSVHSSNHTISIDYPDRRSVNYLDHSQSQLISLVAEREITFLLPFFDQTKGEMVRSLNGLDLADMARATVSCASYPLGHECYKQCGICPACVFRRQAIHIGGIEELQGTYTFDILGTADQVNRISPDKLGNLRAFLMQVSEWTDIGTTGRLPETVERHLHYTQILKPGDSPLRIIDLLARNRDEWLQMAAEGRDRGYAWAWLLAPARISVESGATYASN